MAISRAQTRRLSVVGVAAWSLLLAGCAVSGLKVGSTAQVFDLSLRQTATSSSARKNPRNIQLVVYEPTALRTLDGDRVVVRLANSQVSYLDGASWSDRLPVLLQNRLIADLTTAGQFRAISNGRDKVDPDVSLSSTIQAFQVDLGQGGNQARVTLLVKLVDERSGSVLAARSFDGTSPLTANKPNDHVLAIQEAFHSVSKQLVEWIGVVKIKPRRGKLPPAIARSSQRPEAVAVGKSRKPDVKL